MSASSTITDLVTATTKAGKATIAERATEASAAVLEPLSILMHQVSKGKRSPKDLAPLAEQAEAILNGTATKPSEPSPESTDALKQLLQDDAIPAKLKKALQRILVPSDPEFIDVDEAGTPKVIANLNAEVTRLQTDNEKLTKRAEDAEKKDLPDTAVLKTEVATLLTKHAKAANALTAPTFGSEIKGKPDLVKSLKKDATKYGAKADEDDEKK